MIRPERKDNRRIVRLDGTKEDVSTLPGDVGQLGAVGPVAEPGHGGDADRPVPEAAGHAQGVESPIAETDRQTAFGRQPGQAGAAAQDDPAQSQLIAGRTHGPEKETEPPAGKGPAAGAADHEGALRPNDGIRGGQQLGVSRKTYYKWEQRGLSALLDGLSDQEAGRPEKVENPAEAVLERQLTDLKRENELLEQKLELKDLVADFHIRSQKDRKKKNERIKRMVEKIESLKSQYGISIVSLVEIARLGFANLKLTP